MEEKFQGKETLNVFKPHAINFALISTNYYACLFEDIEGSSANNNVSYSSSSKQPKKQ